MNSKTSLPSSSDHDYSEFLNEYILQSNSQCIEPEFIYEDGEMEAEWLVSIGYPELTKPFERGLELGTTELEPVLATLSKHHAEAIKQRVRALNQTVRGRTKIRPKRKPDIRDVFRDYDESSTGTRSRSATPDSLDSIQAEEVWGNDSIPNFVRIFENIGDTNSPTVQQLKNPKQKLRRTPSAPLKSCTPSDIFRGSHVRCDIPLLSTHGIELLGYSRIGTMHLARGRSGSDPSCSVGRAHGKILRDLHSENNTSGDSSDECIDGSNKKKQNRDMQKLKDACTARSRKPQDALSFESICRDKFSLDEVDACEGCDTLQKPYSDIVLISETDLKRLQPIFWLELATIFDQNHVSLDKRKPFKRRRKEEGHLFGVSLNALIRRDQQVTGKDSTLVPLFLENLLAEISHRGSREEGILRIAGNKQKTEALCNELELIFYQNPEKSSSLIAAATVHELSALLKRWLRELPQPLLTNELIQLFYQCHNLPSIDQRNALSILCQLLPHENRNTFRSILRFLNNIINFKDVNKMNLHNVSTIIAPSFFPPRNIYPRDKNNIEEQLKMAAQCCRLTNILILRGEALFQVPNNFILASKCKKKTGKKGVYPLHSMNFNSGEMENSDGKSSNCTDLNKQSNKPNHVQHLVI